MSDSKTKGADLLAALVALMRMDIEDVEADIKTVEQAREETIAKLDRLDEGLSYLNLLRDLKIAQPKTHESNNPS